MHDIFLSSSFLFIFDLVCLILPTLRKNPRGFWYYFYQLPITQIYSTGTQSPHSQMFPDFYMPLCSTTQTPQFFIILRHQPLISSFTLIWTTILLSHWCNKVLSTINLVVWELKTRKYILERTCLFSSSHCFLFLPPTVHSGNLFQCNYSLHHPLFGAALSSITH
jgi:hypothetical protein